MEAAVPADQAFVRRAKLSLVSTAGVTVAIPGLINVIQGTVVVASNLGWTGVPLIRSLREDGVLENVTVDVRQAPSRL
jgi:hypothetical protein